MNLAPTPFYWTYHGNLVIILAMHEAFLPNSGMFTKLMCVHMCAQSCPTVCNPTRTAASQAPLFMGFSRQEYWSGWPSPSPRDSPYPGTNPMSPASLALQADSTTGKNSTSGKPRNR